MTKFHRYLIDSFVGDVLPAISSFLEIFIVLVVGIVAFGGILYALDHWPIITCSTIFVLLTAGWVGLRWHYYREYAHRRYEDGS